MKNKVIEIDLLTWVKKCKTPMASLRKSANTLAIDVRDHFEEYDHDLKYQFLVDAVFSMANNHNVEDYLLKALVKHCKNVEIVTGKKGYLVIRKLKKQLKKKNQRLLAKVRIGRK